MPTELWKRYALPIGQRVWQLLDASWRCKVSIPKCWSASWLFLIPKPHKGQDRLSGWRPISLQDPCGKAALSILTTKAKMQTTSKLAEQPQFAYLQGRSTGDAIRRVAVHVAHSQHLFGLAAQNLYELRAGNSRLSLGGGFRIFLDVEHAFDAVPRNLLKEAMEKQPLQLDLINLFLSWYASTEYIYRHHEHTLSVQATTGIRQGCVAAPLLWDYHTSNVMYQLQMELGVHWVNDVLTLFADDFHLQWASACEQDFLLACGQLSLFLRILEKLQVRVCAEKSSMMMMLGGNSARTLVEKNIVRRGSMKLFKLRNKKDAEKYGQILLPLVAKQKYLGIIVSYRHMQSLTLSWRIQQAWATFHKLRKWWQPSSLSLKRRTELWRVIVWPTLCYGLIDVGLFKICEKRLHTTVMKQLRIVARSPLHVLRETNEHLIQRIGLVRSF